MNKLDTYDTLKHGCIPIENLFAYAKEKNFNMDNFIENDLDELIYDHHFHLVYDGDFYNISCFVCKDEDDNSTTVNFWANGNFFDDSESRTIPIFPDTSTSFIINCRQDFIDALNKWQYFIAEAYMRILRHRLEVLENLEEIIEAELKIKRLNSSSKKEMYKNYVECFGSTLVNQLAFSIENICNFN
jgi:hypothetical protein